MLGRFVMLFLWLSCTQADINENMAFENNTIPQSPFDNEVEERIRSLLSFGLPHPLRILSLYGDFMEQRSSTCPSLENPNAENWMGVWDDDCETEDGIGYFGTALYGSDMISDDYIDIWLFNILCSFELTNSQGDTFIGGGEIEYKREREQGNTYLQARVNGSFSYPSSNDWLAQNSHSSLFISGSIQDELLYMSLYGGYASSGLALFFDELALFEDSCGYTLSGFLEIRDSSGYWRKAHFTPCTPCASQSWNGQSIEDLCIEESIVTTMLNLAMDVL